MKLCEYSNASYASSDAKVGPLEIQRRWYSLVLCLPAFDGLQCFNVLEHDPPLVSPFIPTIPFHPSLQVLRETERMVPQFKGAP